MTRPYSSLVSASVFYAGLFLVGLLVNQVDGVESVEGLKAFFGAQDYVVFFILAAIVSVFNNRKYYTLVKPLPMLFLLSKCYHSPLIMESHAGSRVVYGLLLGMGGDFFMNMVNVNRSFLIVAALLFFAGHVAYIAAFVQVPLSAGKTVWVPWVMCFIIFMHEYFYFMKKVAPKIEFLFGLCYWVIISVLVVAGANAQVHFGFDSFPFFLLGVLMFWVSDLLIHWTKYVDQTDMIADGMVLPLYFTAQCFILQGAYMVALKGVGL